MTVTNEIRRQVMLTAWVLKREGRQIKDGRTFAQCLGWAWAHVKREAAKAAFATVRVLRLSPSLICSPLGRRFGGRRYGARRDFKAAYTTAQVGA